MDSQLYIWFIQVVNAKNTKAMETKCGPHENTVPIAVCTHGAPGLVLPTKFADSMSRLPSASTQLKVLVRIMMMPVAVHTKSVSMYTEKD